jgi:thymidylate kinase
VVGTLRRSATERRNEYPPTAIVALTAVLDDFSTARLRYCAWKSNVRLRQALAGATDLDLLVDPVHVRSFRQIVARHQLKRMVAPPEASYPGMEHFLGFDRRSGRLFHLHVHYQMVLGERYVKNHRFPMEEEFLDSRRWLSGVPVPAASLELSILVVRALLKYRGRDVIKDIFNIRSPGLPDEVYKEIRWLLDQTSREEIRRVLMRTRSEMPVDVICRFLDIMVRERRPGYALWRLRGSLRKSVRGLRRHNRLRARIEYLMAAWQQRSHLRRTVPQMRRMSPGSGGSSVAIVGADGAGKSTIAYELSKWLSWKLETRVYYMGSKQASRTSRLFYLLFRAQRRGHRMIEGRLGDVSWILRLLAASRDATLALHHVSVGWDRARRYRAALRAEARGTIVIFDRFPLESLTSDPSARLLDGPHISLTLPAARGRITKVLRTIEEGLYQRFQLPAHLIVLQVSPSVSAKRKTDHPVELLAAKCEAVMDLARLAMASGTRVQVTRVDADRPLDEVMREIKARLWDVL